MGELTRKLVRLFLMSPAELAARSAEQRWYWKEFLTTRGSVVAGRRIPYRLGSGPAEILLPQIRLRPFYCFRAEGDVGGLAQSFRELFPRRAAAITKEAESICAGSLRLFGQAVEFPGGKIDWHLDWKTGERFPIIFYPRISLQAPALGANIKRVWEINRHQFLVTLGKAYFLTGGQEYSARIVDLICSWMDTNPPYRGVNWKEGLEEGIRLVSWLWALRLITDAQALTEEVSRCIVAFLALQRDHIERHLSTYSSPNTHLLGEALALFVVGLMFPDLGQARQGVMRAKDILEEQLDQQIAMDGSHREKAAYYHCYALEMYLLATVLGHQHGVQFSSWWMSRVEQMAEFLVFLLLPDGSLARFGDDDGGRTIRLGEENDYYHPRALLAVAAALFERGDFKRVAGALPEEVFWIFGPEGARRYARLTEKEPRQRTIWFEDAQLAVLRTGWGTKDLWLTCQQQPMGMLTAGHSHAGLLSFELALGGKPLIIDPGTYTYATQGPWRDHFRRADAHNGVQINREQWHLPAGPFQWKNVNSAEPLLLNHCSESGVRVGYRVRCKGGKWFQHLRIFTVESPVVVAIHDNFEGKGKCRFTFWLQFASGCRLRLKRQNEFEIGLGDLTTHLVLEGFGKFQFQVWEGSEDPIAGWVSPGFDRKLPAPILCIEDEAGPPAVRTIRLTIQSLGERRVPSGATVSRESAGPG